MHSANTGAEVTSTFQSLWRKQPPPQTLWTNKGKEFYNSNERVTRE